MDRSEIEIFGVPKKIYFNLVALLSKLQFSSTEILLIVYCLEDLDNDWCLKSSIPELCINLNISSRTAYKTLQRLLGFDLYKKNRRYCFRDFLKQMVLLQEGIK